MKAIIRATRPSANLVKGLAAISTLACLAGSVAQGGVTADSSGQLSASSGAAPAIDHDALAKKLANPIAAMISVPFQNNFDFGAGPNGDGFQWKMNVQPVMPFSLNEDWNLITRTIIPVVSQSDIAGTRLNPSGTQNGLADTVFSAWFSPKAPTSGGWIWGFGPAMLIPTGSNDPFLTANQWAAGPTAIVLRSSGKFTYGTLVNHLWTYAGTGGNSRVNSTFIQPFVSYIPGGGWTYSLNTESTYDWNGDQWTVPINAMVSKMFKIGETNAQWQLGGRYYAAKADQGPEWGLRLAVTLLFPKS